MIVHPSNKVLNTIIMIYSKKWIKMNLNHNNNLELCFITTNLSTRSNKMAHSRNIKTISKLLILTIAKKRQL